MNKFAGIIALLAVTITSCKKQTGSPVLFPPKTAHPVLIGVDFVGSANPVERFTYDEHNRLETMLGYYGTALPMKIFYDTKGRPNKAEITSVTTGNLTYVYKFFYKNELLAQAVFGFIPTNGTVPRNTAMRKYDYASGRVIKTTDYQADCEEENCIIGFTTYGYDADGEVVNIIRHEREFDQLPVAWEKTFEYDKNNNPMHEYSANLWSFSPYIELSSHNVKREVLKSGEQRTVTQIVTHTYNYDSAGYPLVRTSKYVNPLDPKEDTSETYTYTYKIAQK